MNLIADIGNTRIKLSITEKGKIIESTQADDDGIGSLEKLFHDYPGVNRAIFSSVRSVQPAFIAVMQQKIQDLSEFTFRTPIPLKVDYQTPETLGMDRLAAASGADGLFPGEELLVIDAGTAITMDR